MTAFLKTYACILFNLLVAQLFLFGLSGCGSEYGDTIDGTTLDLAQVGIHLHALSDGPTDPAGEQLAIQKPFSHLDSKLKSLEPGEEDNEENGGVGSEDSEGSGEEFQDELEGDPIGVNTIEEEWGELENDPRQLADPSTTLVATDEDNEETRDTSVVCSNFNPVASPLIILFAFVVLNRRKVSSMFSA